MLMIRASYRRRRWIPPSNLPASTLALLLLAFCGAAGANEQIIEGRWLTGDGDGWIDISISDDGLSGLIAGSPNERPEDATFDIQNKDPALRRRPLLGLDIFAGFRYDGKKRWKGGSIYDPNRGKTYRCVITIVDSDTLKVRGYIGAPILGETQIWKRVTR